jgi:arylsulfatase A-like enzyme
MRVPFIAAWGNPNADNQHQKRLPISAGVIQSQLAAVYDLFPTILALAGTESPKGHVVDGSRLDIPLAGKSDAKRKATFLMHYPHAPHRSDYFTVYRDGDWKVIYHYFPSEASENSHYQLYNLAKDPFESKNLTASEPAKLREMMKGLTARLEEHKALYPVDQQGGTTIQKPKLP